MHKIDTSLVGHIVHALQYRNGELVRQDDVGIILNKRIGDSVKTGELLLTCNYNSMYNADDINALLNNVYTIDNKKAHTKLIDCVIE